MKGCMCEVCRCECKLGGRVEDASMQNSIINNTQIPSYLLSAGYCEDPDHPYRPANPAHPDHSDHPDHPYHSANPTHPDHPYHPDHPGHPDHPDHLLIDLSSPSEVAEHESDPWPSPCSGHYQELHHRIQRFLYK